MQGCGLGLRVRSLFCRCGSRLTFSQRAHRFEVGFRLLKFRNETDSAVSGTRVEKRYATDAVGS